MKKYLWLIGLILLILASNSFAAVVLLNIVGAKPTHWLGLSADLKPANVNYGSTFYATDSGILYMYGGSGWVIDNRNTDGR